MTQPLSARPRSRAAVQSRTGTMIVAKLSLLGAAGLALLGCSGGEPEDTGAAERDVNRTRLTEFKARHSSRELALNDELRADFAVLNARAHELDPDWRARVVDAELESDPALAEALTSDQIASWRALLHPGRDASVSWDRTAATPASVGLGITLLAATGEEAKAALDARMGALVHTLYGMTSHDAVSQLDERTIERPAELEGELPVVLHAVRYRHHHRGLPVFGDWQAVYLARSDLSTSAWRAELRARWTRNFVTERVQVSAAAATEAARASGNVVEGEPTRAPELGYFVQNGVGRPAYEVWLARSDGPWLYYVSASTGEVLDQSRQTADNHSGVVKYPVKRAYEETPTARPVPFATIYEASVSTPAPQTCDSGLGVVNVARGDSTKINATTDSVGAYTNAVHYNAADLSWNIDFRGTYVSDISSHSVNLYLSGLTAGTVYTYTATTTNARNRRAEVFYLLNHARQTYSAFGIPQYLPLKFTYEPYAPGDPDVLQDECSDPETLQACCGGKAKTGCIQVNCGMGPTAAPLAERRFREVVLHEHNHSLRIKDAGSLCSDDSECEYWEEGRADFAAISLGRFEKSRPEYTPTKSYPADYEATDQLYWKGSVWTDIYTDYMLRTGPAAIGDVSFDLAQVNGTTAMVGACPTTNVTSCPANSFYRYLLSNQQLLSAPRWRNTQEISAAFHATVTDADRVALGVQTFPWADETPNRPFVAPFILTDLAGSGTITVGTGAEGGGSTALNTADDYDSFMFFARAGESYTVSTTSLAAGVDTELEVARISSTQYIQTEYNDDCLTGGPRSCITFVPAFTNFYRLVVHAVPGSVTGPSATYRLQIARTDDYGDTSENAAPVSPDDTMHVPHGVLEAANDVDVFQVSVPDDQNLKVVGCNFGGGSDVRVQIRDSVGALIDTVDNDDCDAGPEVTMVTAGKWFLHVSSPSGTTGSYGLRVGLTNPDIDIDDTPANAWALSTNDILGAAFENGTDEDWYTIHATIAGRTYAVEVMGMDTGVSPDLEVYAPSSTLYGPSGTPDGLPDTSGHGLGHWMLSDSGGGLRTGASRLAFWAPVAGTYHVRVRQAPASSTGRYYLAYTNNSLYTSAYTAYP